jgi:hypothetical protein
MKELPLLIWCGEKKVFALFPFHLVLLSANICSSVSTDFFFYPAFPKKKTTRTTPQADQSTQKP